MKVSELAGALLAHWVAKAEGVSISAHTPAFEPHSNWAHGGPIIERDQIFLSPPRSYHVSGGPNSGWHHVENWTATVSTSTRTIPLEKPDSKLEHNFGTGPGRGKGPTPLVAAMRAKVASHYGDEVPDDLPTSKESGDE